MVYDCFQFFNELDILKLRLHILSDVADRFVISESTVTFSGDPKPLFYEEHKEEFREFADRIIHVVVRDTPMDCDAFARDHHQKCAVIRGLADAKPDDIVIFSDVDEIPNPDTLRTLLPQVEDGRIYMLAQRLFYGCLNLEDVSGNNLSVTGEFEGANPRRWLGTKVCRRSMLDIYTMEQLRDAAQKAVGVRLQNPQRRSSGAQQPPHALRGGQQNPQPPGSLRQGQPDCRGEDRRFLSAVSARPSG